MEKVLTPITPFTSVNSEFAHIRPEGQLTDGQPGRRSKPTKMLTKSCKVCEAPANYSYFGAVVCHSCKTFFRRYAENGKKKFKCTNEQHCLIDVNTRRSCCSCRLKKCFSVGMCVDLIRASRSATSKAKLQKASEDQASNRSMVPYVAGQTNRQLSLTTIHRQHISSITLDQQRMIEQLVQSFIKLSGLTQTNEFLHQQNSLPVKLRFRPHVLTNFASYLGCQTQLSVEKIRDFHLVSSHDRLLLIRNNTFYTTAFLFGVLASYSHILEYSVFNETAEFAFGLVATSFARRYAPQLDSDSNVIAMLTAIVALSHSSIIDQNEISHDVFNYPETILSAQNFYVELLWRYLFCKHGQIGTMHRWIFISQLLVKLQNTLFETLKIPQMRKIFLGTLHHSQMKYHSIS